MIHGDLANVQSQVFNLWVLVLRSFQQCELQPAIRSRVTNMPFQRIQNMPFHLREHLLVVERTAHRLQFPNQRDSFLLIPILSRDQKSSTANQLIMSLINDSPRAIPVKKVDCMEEGFGKELKCSMGFD